MNTTSRRFWFSFNFYQTGGNSHMGWCFGTTEAEAVEAARADARRFKAWLPNLETAQVWLREE